MENGNNTIAKIDLHLEIRLAYKLIEFGLSSLQKEIDNELSNYISFFCFSIGLERIFKTILTLNHYIKIKNGIVCDINLKKEYSHNLNSLFTDVKSLVEFDDGYLSRNACFNDLEYLSNDKVLNKYLEYLSNFADMGRYSVLDAATGHKNSFDLREVINNLDSLILEKHPELLKKCYDNIGHPIYVNEIDNTLVRERIVIIERLMCALSRLFTLSSLHDEGRSFYSDIKLFLLMERQGFGTHEY